MPAPQPSQSRFRRGLRTLIVNPVASTVLLLLLMGSLASLPHARGPGGSTIGEFIRRDLPTDVRSTWSSYTPERYIVREPAGLRAIDPDSESWDELSRIIDQRPRDVAHARYHDESYRTGFWAETRVVHRNYIQLSPMAGDWTPDEEARARALMLRELKDEQPPDRDAVLTAAGYSSTTILWSGYLHNTAALAAFILFVLSLRWIPDTRRRLRAKRRDRALARGLCPSCGYSIKDLPAGPCPECGRS
jgi:hypothetical protein